MYGPIFKLQNSKKIFPSQVSCSISGNIILPKAGEHTEVSPGTPEVWPETSLDLWSDFAHRQSLSLAS